MNGMDYIWIFTGHLLQNLALNQNAVQSSNNDSLGFADKAVDGNRDSSYQRGSCTLTTSQSDPWWRVDLKKVYTIGAVLITSTVELENGLDGAEIWIGKSTEINDHESMRCAVISHFPSGQTFYFPCRSFEGQYVTVFLPGSKKILSLCEVEVYYGYPSPNLALKGEATQSSTLSFAAASKAIDGRRNSFYTNGFCSHTAEDETDPWWRVDLQHSFTITTVKVTNRGDCCAERLDGAEIRIGNSLENNGNNNPKCASISHIKAGKTYTYQCDGGSMEGRFVNLFLPGQKKTLTLCEVEVYAARVEPLPNVALNKETVQSSTWSGTEYWASKAVDGCRNGQLPQGCCTHTSPTEDSPWWHIDLLGLHKVTAVTIINRVGTPKAVTPPPTPPPSPPTVSVLLGERNVMVVGKRLCWSDALMYCRHYHWDLLSLHSQQEQDELEQLLGSLPFTLTDYIWLGLRRSLRGNDWFWMSGHSMNFFHWPQNWVPRYYSNTCGGMGSTEDFQWKDIHCAGDDMQRVYFYSTKKDRTLE
uniref:uncharacterized protein LOC101464769 n=1 Tax=Maylandia zebra TaxID=106582 RepID=UPI000C237A71|nr:uncharacterized protein LOC101464769 [Maylandia zebra]